MKMYTPVNGGGVAIYLYVDYEAQGRFDSLLPTVVISTHNQFRGQQLSLTSTNHDVDGIAIDVAMIYYNAAYLYITISNCKWSWSRGLVSGIHASIEGSIAIALDKTTSSHDYSIHSSVVLTNITISNMDVTASATSGNENLVALYFERIIGADGHALAYTNIHNVDIYDIRTSITTLSVVSQAIFIERYNVEFMDVIDHLSLNLSRGGRSTILILIPYYCSCLICIIAGLLMFRCTLAMD
jgi:hypothetical protein